MTDAIRLGEVTITRVVELARSAFPNGDMRPESSARAGFIARDDGGLRVRPIDAVA